MDPKSSANPRDQQPVQSHVSALWQVGMFKPYDLAMLAVLMLLVVTTFFWWLFKRPALAELAVPLLAFNAVMTTWAVTLMYRCIWFVIKTWTDIKMLPVSAAKLAISFTRGSVDSNER